MQDLINWVIEQHGYQKYGKHPKSYHLESVVSMTKGLYGDSTYLEATAWLHDVLEDCDVNEESVAEVLLTCTVGSKFSCSGGCFDLYDVYHNIIPALHAISKQEGEFRNEYISRVKSNSLARRVKIADAMCNLRECLKDGNLSRAQYYQDTIDLLISQTGY